MLKNPVAFRCVILLLGILETVPARDKLLFRIRSPFSWAVRRKPGPLTMKALRKLLAVNRARVNMSSIERAKVISYEDVKKLVAEGEAKVFDVRSPEEVANGRIANSVNIPVAEVEEAFKMDPETFKMKYGVNKPRRDEENLVFHCQMGKRGARATEIAVALGYVKARNYAGGYKEWSEKEGK